VVFTYIPRFYSASMHSNTPLRCCSGKSCH